MYRTTDPRFRRRINDLTSTLESANETAQSGLYIFGQNYVQPCFSSIGQCLTGCVDASCPGGLGRRRQRVRGRSRTDRAELSFDFYDDWEVEDETDGLLGWGQPESLGGGYGTVAPAASVVQPGRTRGMSYPKVGTRRKSDGLLDPTVIPGSHTGFWSKLFGGGKPLRYKPSAADLQDHPGSAAARRAARRDITEGEALLEETSEEEGGLARKHRRARSGTQASHDTGSSYSSRGDIFPSDNEDDAVPLDDEFAMVLERRTTQSGQDTENSSNKTADRKRGKRPSAGSRTSTRRTFSSRSSGSARKGRSRAQSEAAQTVIDEASVAAMSEAVALKDEAFAKEALHSSVISERPPSMSELKQQERALEREEEEAVERKRQEAYRAAEERGLVIPGSQSRPATAMKEEVPQVASTPHVAVDEQSHATDEEEEGRRVNEDTVPSIEDGKGKDGSD